MILRANELAEAIIARKPHLTAMQLQKLLYYVEAWHLAITNTPLFEDDCFRAYAKGPVVEDVWHQRKDPASRRKATNGPDLTPTAEAIVELVVSEYGGRSGDELSVLTHSEKPWLDARKGLQDGASSRRIIPNEAMARFFRDHRQLGGRTAADLAAGGVMVRDQSIGPERLDLEELLESLDSVDDHTLSGYQANIGVDLTKVDHTGLGPRPVVEAEAALDSACR